jgi:Tfp pilus assembly protein FimV
LPEIYLLIGDCILERFTEESAGKFKAIEQMESAIARITEKSVGLLQADSILAAIAAVYATQRPERAFLSRLVLVLALISCVLLATNLAICWPRNTQMFKNATDGFAFAMTICRSRARRFTTALVTSTLAFAIELLEAVVALFR